ncbi:MAG: hypothetical protein EZS28_018762 [Streblomastix strix]|uniref:Uncharacterized protein n=1 Tax=Streblomastix strix TaxID=222440 RepID=A0A5J4VSW7_9EUKA|nr:MAG: hypothetical protein EZS28_018762 [Streblomastix strix]
MMDDQIAQAAQLKRCFITMIMIKITNPDIIWWIAKFRANIIIQQKQISPQMKMTIDATPSGRGSTLEKESEMIAAVHGT